jgi:hypothetical protein
VGVDVGGGSAGEVVGGEVAGLFVVEDAGGVCAAFGGGRSGPLMPHDDSIAISATTTTARGIRT